MVLIYQTSDTFDCIKTAQKVLYDGKLIPPFADCIMVAMSLPADYGYVIMTGVGAIFMVMWKGIRVGKARKEHGVQYPDMYSQDNKVMIKTSNIDG